MNNPTYTIQYKTKSSGYLWWRKTWGEWELTTPSSYTDYNKIVDIKDKLEKFNIKEEKDNV